jgi:NADH:ubiquinone oxidoreductase subunit H
MPLALMFFIAILAETNRTPFDLLEAESELVAGFLVEYSSIIFAAFYLGEYSIILFLSVLLSILFFGSLGFSIFTLIILFIIILIRSTLPRLRFDQLISLG